MNSLRKYLHFFAQGYSMNEENISLALLPSVKGEN